MWQFMKTVFYYVSGMFLFSSEKLGRDPNVMRAEYEAVIKEKQGRAQQISNAVAGVEAQRLKTMDDLERVTKEIEELDQDRQGAIALAKKKAEKIGAEKATTDTEINKWMALYNDATTTLEEKKNRISELEKRAEQLQEAVSKHVVQLTEIKNEIEKLASEKNEAIADVVTATEISNINNTVAGIKSDGSAAQLESLRNRRRQANAEVSISGLIAGTDTAINRAEMRKAARESRDSEAFMKLIGVTDNQDAPVEVAASVEKLPEN
jgi:chromosome segregation ATPase